MFQCKDDASSLYCDQFAPNWERVAPGGGSIHTSDLGWTPLGDCQGMNDGSGSDDDGRGDDGGRGDDHDDDGRGDDHGGGDYGDYGSSTGQEPFDGSLSEGGADRCWRSGTLCDSDAAFFACCTSCYGGVCT